MTDVSYHVQHPQSFWANVILLMTAKDILQSEGSGHNVYWVILVGVIKMTSVSYTSRSQQLISSSITAHSRATLIPASHSEQLSTLPQFSNNSKTSAPLSEQLPISIMPHFSNISQVNTMPESNVITSETGYTYGSLLVLSFGPSFCVALTWL